jgi:hypothetical protein
LIGTRVERPRPDGEKVPESSIGLELAVGRDRDALGDPVAAELALGGVLLGASVYLVEDERRVLEAQVAERHLVSRNVRPFLARYGRRAPSSALSYRSHEVPSPRWSNEAECPARWARAGTGT